MRAESRLLQRSSRVVVLILLAVGLLAVWSVAFPALRANAGSIRFTCWDYDRGNAKVCANPGRYGDYRDKPPGLMMTGSGESPFVVEYDVDFPVTATYTLRVRYASAGVRPLDVMIDDQRVGTCCTKKTNNAPPYPDRHPQVHKGLPERTWHMHGAEWEESCKFQVAKGKRRLKFTRNGPPANLINIQISTPAAFPKDYKPIKRKFDLNRIPPTHRRIFLTPGAVNIATLRLAIADKIKDFGPQYPNGPQHLKELSELEAKQKTASTGSPQAAADGSPEQKQEIKKALAALRQKAMLDHPALKFDRLLFAGGAHHAHPKTRKWRNSNLFVLSPVRPDGKITELVPELTGGGVGRFDLSFDAKRIVFSYGAGYRTRIYEIDIDPATGLRTPGKPLRQLTCGGDEEKKYIREYEKTAYGYGFRDIDPCYLPNGKIMVVSSRSRRAVLCRPEASLTLHVMDADGKNISCISGGQVHELAPALLKDGRVAYSRWEYIDKGFGNAQGVWAVRPDGSGSDHVYKNMLVRPGAMINACSIPGSRKIAVIGIGHHGGLAGPVIVVDARRHRRTADAMTNITPEIEYPGMFPMTRNRGFFSAPYPFSEKFFLVSHGPFNKDPIKAEHAIYALDAWGNRAELYRNPDLACYQPVPLRPRYKPVSITPVDPDSAPETQYTKAKGLATMFMLDVYQGLEGIERGRVKHLRVMGAMNLSWRDAWRSTKQGDNAGMQASAVSGDGDVSIKKVFGIATVHADGSAFFTVPAKRNLFFQALDKNYMELDRMRTFINLTPGENRSCIGCHEFRREAPQIRNTRPIAMSLPIENLRPQPGDTGPRRVHYASDIQPIFDKHCIGCHSGKTPKGDLNLEEKLTVKFSESYNTLKKKRLVSYLEGGFGSANLPVEPLMTFGSHRSKLVERIRKDPCKSKITREEFIKIVTWIDANAPYYGTHKGKKNLRWKGDADFRPVSPADE